MQFSVRFDKKEIEKYLSPACFQTKSIISSPQVVSEEKVYIIPQDDPGKIKEAYWAYNDHVLQDLMGFQNRMKCIIIGNSLSAFCLSNNPNEEDLIVIKGVCIDHGGENYIAYPQINIDSGEIEKVGLGNISKFFNER